MQNPSLFLFCLTNICEMKQNCFLSGLPGTALHTLLST